MLAVNPKQNQEGENYYSHFMTRLHRLAYEPHIDTSPRKDSLPGLGDLPEYRVAMRIAALCRKGGVNGLDLIMAKADEIGRELVEVSLGCDHE